MKGTSKKGTLSRNERIINLKLSLQRALLGCISPSMRAVTGKITQDSITIIAYYSSEVTEEEIELLYEVGTEVIADFSTIAKIEEKPIVTDVEKHSLKCLDFWAYFRYEGN